MMGEISLRFDVSLFFPIQIGVWLIKSDDSFLKGNA